MAADFSAMELGVGRSDARGWRGSAEELRTAGAAGVLELQRHGLGNGEIRTWQREVELRTGREKEEDWGRNAGEKTDQKRMGHACLCYISRSRRSRG
jgi:hypothetical protein